MALSHQIDDTQTKPLRYDAQSLSRIERQAADLVVSGSLEMGAHRPKDARDIADLLPQGTTVFVNHLPKHTLDQSMEALVALTKAGLEPVPHIAARRIKSRAEVVTFLKRAASEAGVKKVLVIGGDMPEVHGPYSDGLSIIADGVLTESGIREVALPSYPEGHPVLATPLLETSLAAKIAAARTQSLGVSVISQFSFHPARVIEHVASLDRLYPDVPVYVGLAGPTSPAALIRYAHRCGVSASLRALSREGMRAVNLVTHTDPIEQLTALARHMATQRQSNVVGVHLFTFGGVGPAAAWMNAVVRRAPGRVA
jgi:methylenetetrahydrofolate reductase (NADPH)